jgi:hypothetical protein
VTEGVPGHAAPMKWVLVKNPNDEPGMTPEEIDKFLNRPIEGVGRLPSSNAKEATDGEG